MYIGVKVFQDFSRTGDNFCLPVRRREITFNIESLISNHKDGVRKDTFVAG